MKILSKSESKAAVLESLFKPIEGKSLGCIKKERLDRGKYSKSSIGEEIPDCIAKNIFLAWSEKKSDKHGVYYVLYCLPKQYVFDGKIVNY